MSDEKNLRALLEGIVTIHSTHTVFSPYRDAWHVLVLGRFLTEFVTEAAANKERAVIIDAMLEAITT